MSLAEEIFMEVAPLKPVDKLQLVDKILESLNPISEDIARVWAKESEDRIAAYENGHISTVNEKEVFSKYSR